MRNAALIWMVFLIIVWFAALGTGLVAIAMEAMR